MHAGLYFSVSVSALKYELNIFSRLISLKDLIELASRDTKTSLLSIISKDFIDNQSSSLCTS